MEGICVASTAKLSQNNNSRRLRARPSRACMK
jgi:hypothetical protein